MKLFKKALLATAVFGAMGAQAASINNDTFKLSQEGIALEVTATASEFYLDVKVDKDHPSGSIITLTFDENVDLSNVAAAANGDVTQTVASGVASSGNVFFDYGTGSFTFDDVVLTQANAATGTPASISFKVNLGNPLTANSAFRIAFFDDQTGAGLPAVDGDGTFQAGEELVIVSGESVVNFKSVVSSNDDTVIDTGSVKISEVVSQFSFKVDTPLDGLIQRDDLETFVGDVKTDALKYTLVNDETLGLALKGVKAGISFAGKFTGITAAAPLATNFAAVSDPAATNTGAAVGTLSLPTGTGTTPIAVLDSYVMTSPATAAKDAYVNTVDFTNGATSGIEIPVTGDVEATVTVTDASNATVGANGYTLFSKVPAGEWAIDATIINVPYLPINATGTQSFIHFANETDSEVDVIVTAIDGNGNEYGPMDLGLDLPANTVYKLGMPAIDKLFTLNGASTKLSITFNIDADKGDVNAYAVSQNDKGRTEVSTSQQRGN